MRNKFLAKLLSLSLSASMLFAFATVAKASNGAETEAVSSHPVITGEVTDVDEGWVTISFSISSDAGYSFTYDSKRKKWSGAEASAYTSAQVELTLDTDLIDTLFDSDGVIISSDFTEDGKITNGALLFPFATGSLQAGIKDDDVLFTIEGMLNDNTLTLEDLAQYNFVSSFDNVILTTKIYPVSGSALGTLAYSSNYRTDGNGDFDDITTNFVYSPAPGPIISEDFDAEVDATTGEVTFANTDKATDTSSEFMTALEDNKVKLFNNKLTGVKADSRFTITYTPTGETKTFGHTIGEHFGISGDGAIEGTVAIALLFDKALDPTGFALEY